MLWTRDAPAVIQGNEMDYRLSDGLLGTGFKYNRYQPPTSQPRATGSFHAVSSQARKLLVPHVRISHLEVPEVLGENFAAAGVQEAVERLAWSAARRA